MPPTTILQDTVLYGMLQLDGSWIHSLSNCLTGSKGHKDKSFSFSYIPLRAKIIEYLQNTEKLFIATGVRDLSKILCYH